MALKLIPLDEAARTLGITVERLNELRERGKIYGYRDGASWKFKQPDIDRLAEELRAPSEEDEAVELSDSLADSLGGDPLAATLSEASDELLPELSEITPQPTGSHSSDSVDVVLLSDRELGSSEPGTSSTIIGKPGVQSPEESDIRLIGPADRRSGAGSDVKLKVDSKASESGLRLVPEPRPEVVPDAPTDLRLEDSEDLSIDVLSDSSEDDLPVTARQAPTVKPASPRPGKAKPAEKDSGELDLAGPDSDEEFAIADIRAPAPKSGDSGIALASHELEDDDLVLSSSGGSDITLGSADSGISLASPSDSGLSLEEPFELKSAEEESLELGGDEFGIAEADSDSADVAPADDDFLLTPIEEAADVDSEDSGSQVIALDSDSGFGDSGLLAADSGGAMLEEDFGAPEGGAALGMGLSPAPALAAGGVALPGLVGREAPYTVWNILSLVACTMILSITGMMMFDLIRNMWSWDSPYGFNSFIMDTITGLAGK